MNRRWIGSRSSVDLHDLCGLGEVVDAPDAQPAVGGDGEEVVGVLGADDAEAEDGVGVAAQRREGRPAHGVLGLGVQVPDDDLPGVGAADDHAGVEGVEGGGEDGRLAAQHVLGAVQQVVQRPQQHQAVGGVAGHGGGVAARGVRDGDQVPELGGEAQRRDGAVLGPALVAQLRQQRDVAAGALAVAVLGVRPFGVVGKNVVFHIQGQCSFNW